MRASRAAAQHRNPAPSFDGQSIPAGDALQGPRARKLQYGGCDIANMRKTLLDAARRNVWTRNERGGSDAAFRRVRLIETIGRSGLGPSGTGGNIGSSTPQVGIRSDKRRVGKERVSKG